MDFGTEFMALNKVRIFVVPMTTDLEKIGGSIAPFSPTVSFVARGSLLASLLHCQRYFCTVARAVSVLSIRTIRKSAGYTLSSIFIIRRISNPLDFPSKVCLLPESSAIWSRFEKFNDSTPMGYNATKFDKILSVSTPRHTVTILCTVEFC